MNDKVPVLVALAAGFVAAIVIVGFKLKQRRRNQPAALLPPSPPKVGRVTGFLLGIGCILGGIAGILVSLSGLLACMVGEVHFNRKLWALIFAVVFAISVILITRARGYLFPK